MAEGLPDDTQGLLLYGIGPSDNLIQLVCTADGHLEVVTMPHVSTHQDGGSDELNVANLSGVLADYQNAKVGIIDQKADFPGSYTLGRLLWATDESKAYMDLAASRIPFGVTKYSDLTDTDHASQHENGGADELSIENLSLKASGDELVFTSNGANDLILKNVTDSKTVLTIDQDTGDIDGVDITDHSGRHQNGGSDEINVAGLSGLLADNQNPTAHASEHANGGVDEISVTGLSGLLATDQNPTAHASNHANGGSDALAALDTAESLSDLLPLDGGRNMSGCIATTSRYGIARSTEDDLLVLGTDAGYHDEPSIVFWSKDQGSIPGRVDIYFGSGSAGYNLDAELRIHYLANGESSNAVIIDKDGNLTTTGAVNGIVDEGTPWASVTSNDALSTGWETKSLGSWTGSNCALVWLRVKNDDTSEHGVWVRPAGVSNFTKTANAGDQSSLSSLIPAGDYGYFMLFTSGSGQIDISGDGSFNVDIDIGTYISLS